MILSLKRQLATAGPAQLAAISAAVNTAMAQASATAHQAQEAASANTANAALGSAQVAAQEAVNDFEDAYFKQHKFDAYLQFKSAEDERQFRQREAERQAEIEKARAEHTPEGDKHALDLTLAQLDDAGAHGADRSPDYAALRKKVVEAKAALDPLVGKPKVATASTAQPAADPLDSVEATPSSVPPDLLAKFKAAGVIVADQSGTGHGISESSAQQDRGVRLPS